MVRCTTLATACTTTPGRRTTRATIRARKKADGTVSYTAQIRIKKNGAQVYQESQTFVRRKAAEAKRVYLGITDRLKDIFRVGGFNCYPAEIEAGLLEHPAVAQVAVPDERRGDACRLMMCMI